MSFFYSDKNAGVIKEELLTDKAIQWAKGFLNPQRPRDRRQKNPKLTSAQLRKFHSEAKELEARTKTMKQPDDFYKLRPLVKMLKSKAAYSCPATGRERKIPVEFKQFIDEMVDHVNDLKDFQAFCLCFEAVVGFFYGQGGR